MLLTQYNSFVVCLNARLAVKFGSVFLLYGRKEDITAVTLFGACCYKIMFGFSLRIDSDNCHKRNTQKL